MGIAFSSIQKMDELGLFGNGSVRILDIGSSNLYSATADGIKVFLNKHGSSSLSDADQFADLLAAGSSYDSVSGGRNESFVGELFEKAGMEYVSFDIADGFRTTILDLNNAHLSDNLKGKFSLVLNFGTTEHILNQLNCFKVIHDATRVGGYIYHSLPAVGYVDHGYITYTGRCFFDVAGFNEYELLACWFDGPGGENSIFDSLHSYSGYFPALKMALEQLDSSEQGRALRELSIPDIGINIVYRKVKDKPFWGALESSTSVGAIPSGITGAYQGIAGGTDVVSSALTSLTGSPVRLKQRIASALHSYPSLYRLLKGTSTAVADTRGPSSDVTVNEMTHEELALRDRLLAGDLSLSEALHLYTSMIGRGLTFPLEWEERVLRMGLTADPDRHDMLTRLRHVLVSLGKPVDAEIETAFAEKTVREEHSQDHQHAAAEYHTKTGMADMDEAFLPIYESCRQYSMTSVERMYALYKAIHYLEDARIAGDIVECGVWRGGSMMVVANTLAARGCMNRGLYLFDTYEGLPRPDDDKDIDIWGNRAIDGWLPRSAGEEKSHWAEASEEEVRNNLLSTDYPATQMHFIKGMVERTIPAKAPEQIALLRLDTDWYASTKHELENLFDRLSPNGVLIIDDYGHFKGARKAVDEFFATRRIPILLNRIDYTGRLAIKPAGC